MPAKAKGKPNILFILADDIGWFNAAATTTASWATKPQTSTASPRKARCSPTSTGSKVAPRVARPSSPASRLFAPASPRSALPGATLGLNFEDPSVGEFMKNFGYATGQFGKNHLGDRNEHLPTVHGFDEFFGNLYHLNAEEEPYYPNYPKDPEFRKKFGPRGVLKCKATEQGRPHRRPAVRQGRQTDDREHRAACLRSAWRLSMKSSLGSALDFIDRKTKEGSPWFCYFNPTRMHIFTHLKPSSGREDGPRRLSR